MTGIARVFIRSIICATFVPARFAREAPVMLALLGIWNRDFLGTTVVLSSSYTGAKLELMSPQLAQFFGSENGAGLLVRSVDGNSPADLAGIKAGDVVVKINSVPVTNEASSDARNNTAAASSSGLPRRPSGTWGTNWAAACSASPR